MPKEFLSEHHAPDGGFELMEVSNSGISLSYKLGL
jgi:hypothetical protein